MGSIGMYSYSDIDPPITYKKGHVYQLYFVNFPATGLDTRAENVNSKYNNDSSNVI